MAALSSSSVTYTVVAQTKTDRGDKSIAVKLAFGDGTSTYPSGGIPLLAASLGCPNFVRSLTLFDQSSGDGYLYKYDSANKKIRIYQNAAAAGQFAEISTSTAPAATTLVAEVIGW